ncbi:hypothetical protein D9613_008163 [Agrocybe pediades]|uniref:Uncharacterized protein n=1 Tax=Agrocybe pediades TaxID=84607 RepID=A0A8H4VJU0_9AGAR|nr:hypothetical protein D9613_008163 [Agrocybe pediades]
MKAFGIVFPLLLATLHVSAAPPIHFTDASVFNLLTGLLGGDSTDVDDALTTPKGCIWKGTAPFCNESIKCPSGYKEHIRDACGDGWCCILGIKKLCCKEEDDEGGAGLTTDDDDELVPISAFGDYTGENEEGVDEDFD